MQGYEDGPRRVGHHRTGSARRARTLERFAANHAILTGYLHEVARIKLEVFDLAGFLDFDSSAFGDYHAERSELVQIARRRAEAQAGARFDDEHVVLIGDTPNDVKVGPAAGVRVIGVATGKTSEGELRDAGAEQVVSSLREIELEENNKPSE